jgi:hypothetical protein
MANVAKVTCSKGGVCNRLDESVDEQYNTTKKNVHVNLVKQFNIISQVSY